jgi:shikimate kinase
MGVTDKVWDALTTVIKMNDKVVSLAGTVKEQQTKIETLTERVIRLEATLELLMRAGGNMKKLPHS